MLYLLRKLFHGSSRFKTFFFFEGVCLNLSNLKSTDLKEKSNSSEFASKGAAVERVTRVFGWVFFKLKDLFLVIQDGGRALPVTQ